MKKGSKDRKQYVLFPRRLLSAEHMLVEELTVEKRCYAVALKSNQVYNAAYREGHQWFTKGGVPVAESDEIVSINIPARRL